jgi:formylmethanofuran dehydrogenase subunit E
MCQYYKIQINNKQWLKTYGKSTIILTNSEKYAYVFSKKSELQSVLVKMIKNYERISLVVFEMNRVRVIDYTIERLFEMLIPNV